MEMTARSFWTMVHGMGFGALYLLACSGALVELWRRFSPAHMDASTVRDESFLKLYLAGMTVLAWITVLTGAYVIYPWYRAAPPAGTADLLAFPQALLKARAQTMGWHSLGMEWKEHVAWVTPISITMAAAVFFIYGRQLREQVALRRAVLGFTCVSFAAAGVAGFFGAMLDKYAPVLGGPVMHFMR